METKYYHIHGDNIVECVRTFDYILSAVATDTASVAGPSGSVTCPRYELKLLSGDVLIFIFLPGFGERRWNQDILAYVQSSGGRLREATDSIVTRLANGVETPIFAIEYCGALPAGNNAWQRQGRAFSYAHSGIPYFFLAELGGFELNAERERKAERWPNPAVPFSFFAMTHYHGSACLPVYEANSGARTETIMRYSNVFGKEDFLEYIHLILTNQLTPTPAHRLSEKCMALVELLASSRMRQGGLTKAQWGAARKTVEDGGSLTAFLATHAPLAWRKKVSIPITETARAMVDYGARHSLGLTSNDLPLSFVPRDHRRRFADGMRAIYPDLTEDVISWLASSSVDLAIAWVAGFKPRGDDARPDRGLPPLARMLVGDSTHLLTFIYGPAPASHWKLLSQAPGRLAASNGLWEAALGVSDALLVDSMTLPAGFERAKLKSAWIADLPKSAFSLYVNPVVLSPSEHDVDTALHVLFESLGSDIVFEGMCNPPGGDWSGVSFVWSTDGGEHRWLTLPRVTAEGSKRPDHVFALFGLGESALCLCVESKEHARSLESGIGPRLTSYTKTLFTGLPSIWRQSRSESWGVYDGEWLPQPSEYASMGAYVAGTGDPFRNVPRDTALDIVCGFRFSADSKKCVAHVRALTALGRLVLDHIIAASGTSPFVEFRDG